MANQTDLHELRQDDLQQTTDTSGAHVTTLGVQIAGQNWLVEMGNISEVLPLPPLAVVPFTKPWFRGVVKVRGNLYGVIDMAAYGHSSNATSTGAAQASGESGNRVLIVAERLGVNAALLVDCVLGLRDVRAWRQSERLDKQIEYSDEHGRLWRKLDVQGLVEQAEFMQIGD